MNMRSSARRLLGLAALALPLLACSGATPPPEEPPPSLDEPGDQPSSSQETVAASSAKVQEGIDLIKAQNFEAAKTVLTSAHEENPKDAQAAFYLGVTHAELGDAERGKELFRTALGLDPKLAEAAEYLSALLLDQKDAKGALEVVDAALKATPKHPGLLMNRALALEASGNKDGAVQAYAAASAVQPDNQELRYAYAELLAASGKKERAVDELKRVVQGTDDARLLAAASRQLGKLDAFADCVAALDKAIRGKPTADLHVRRGVCRHDLKDNAGARADYDAALALDAKYPPAHYYLGMHLREQGKKKEAATHLESAIKLGAGTPIAEAAKKALDELRKK